MTRRTYRAARRYYSAPRALFEIVRAAFIGAPIRHPRDIAH